MELAELMMDEWLTELGRPTHQRYPVERWWGGERLRQEDAVAEEVPVAMMYNGRPHAVMLASPLDLEDFALGFSLTEGILDDPSELHAVRVLQHAAGIEVAMRIPEHRAQALQHRGRSIAGRTGCGLCGTSTLEQAIRRPPPVAAGCNVSTEALQRALDDLRNWQSLNQVTGAVHAAAWVCPEGNIRNLREDVGRHNALDKLIGVLKRTRTDLEQGFVLVTSRASYEMVQKTASAGIATLVAISAPTGLAIRLAEETGMTLIGFARNDNRVVYSHPHRLTSMEAVE